MQAIRTVQVVAAAAVLLTAAMAGVSAGQPSEAITKPSADLALTFVRPGRIAEMLVKEGDTIKPGQLLARQEDEAELIELRGLKAQADDTTRVRAAAAQLDSKKEDLKRYEWAAGEGAATQFEVEHARLEVVIGELSLELAKFQHEQDQFKYEQTKAQVDRLRLLSTVTGRVETIIKRAGESPNAQENVMRVVSIDPLWVDAPVPLALGMRLKVGDPAQVIFTTLGREVLDGKVSFIAAVADAASGTITVRLEIANPKGRPAGERCAVAFKGVGEPPAPASKDRPQASAPEKPRASVPEKSSVSADK